MDVSGLNASQSLKTGKNAHFLNFVHIVLTMAIQDDLAKLVPGSSFSNMTECYDSSFGPIGHKFPHNQRSHKVKKKLVLIYIYYPSNPHPGNLT